MDKSKTSQDKRERDRKPDDPWPDQLLRSEAQDPSKSQNSERMEQYRGGRKGKKGNGRRGRKNHKQGRKVDKQRRVNTCERNSEIQERIPLIRKVRGKFGELAGRCEQGLVISKHKLETKARSPHIFTSDGLVVKHVDTAAWIRLPGHHHVIHVERVRPWNQLSSAFLKSILKKAWRPFEMKSVLDILAEL